MFTVRAVCLFNVSHLWVASPLIWLKYVLAFCFILVRFYFWCLSFCCPCAVLCFCFCFLLSPGAPAEHVPPNRRERQLLPHQPLGEFSFFIAWRGVVFSKQREQREQRRGFSLLLCKGVGKT